MGWHPCCCEACIALADTFDRADDTDLGGNWVEEVGDWEIASNKLTVPTANAWVRTSPAAGTGGNLYCRATATVRSDTDGDIVRVGLLDSGGATAIVWAELVIGATATLTLYTDSGAEMSMACDVTAPVDTDHELQILIDDDEEDATEPIACVFLNGVRILSAYCANGIGAATANGYLGTGGTAAGTITFDDFTLETIADLPGGNDEECPSVMGCCWPNEPGGLPDQIQVVVAGMTGGGVGECSAGECTALNGTYVLDRVAASTPTECARYEVAISKACDGGTLDTLRLAIMSGDGTGEALNTCSIRIGFYEGVGVVLEGILSTNDASGYYIPDELCFGNSPVIPADDGPNSCSGGTYTLTPL